MRRKNLLASVAVFGALVTGCGGPSEAEQREAAQAEQAEQSAEAEAERKEQAEAEAAAKREEQQAAYEECKSVTEPLRSALGQMDSRLSIGLNYDEYTTRLGDVQVAYDKVVPQLNMELGQPCVTSAVRLENAFNEYTKVSNAWGECIDDIYCDFNEGAKKDQAQAGWQRATTAIDRSMTALERIAP